MPRIRWDVGFLSIAGLLATAQLAEADDLKPPIPAEQWAKVEDDRPLLRSADQGEEHKVLNALIVAARKSPQEALAKVALPGITGRELFGPDRKQYRGQVVHVVGRLTKLEAIESDGYLAAEGVKKLFRGWIQDDTTPDIPLCVLVSELGAGLRPAEKIANVWVTLDGYYLKRLKYREGKVDRLAPLIVGCLLRRNDATTEAPAKTPLELGDPSIDCPRAWLDHIEDDQPVRGALENDGDEYNAYNYFILFAREVPPDLLAKHARQELTFNVLFQADRSKYRGEIIHVEGKLLRLKWIGSNSALEAAGVRDLWEAWVFEDKQDGNPTCVIVSELPEGIKPADEIFDTRASLDGYFFKRYKYKAKDATRLAPLAIGRSMKVSQAPPATGSASTYESLLSGIVPVGIILVVGLAITLIVLTWWFRRGDKQVQVKLSELRSERLFPDEPPAAGET